MIPDEDDLARFVVDQADANLVVGACLAGALGLVCLLFVVLL